MSRHGLVLRLFPDWSDETEMEMFSTMMGARMNG
jgi:hypothetical protein